MSLEGTDVAIRLAGSGAKQLAMLLYAVLKDDKKTKGKTRLAAMLRSGRELRVFAVRDGDLGRFCKEAGRYGVLYTVLKDRDAADGLTDVMVKSEDASKINRIFERFGLATVDMTSVRTEIERERAEGPAEERPETTREQKVEEFLDRALGREKPEDPVTDQTAGSRQSGPSSERRQPIARDASESPVRKPSVKKELEEIKAEQRKTAEAVKSKTPEHRAPKRRKRKKEERAR